MLIIVFSHAQTLPYYRETWFIGIMFLFALYCFFEGCAQEKYQKILRIPLFIFAIVYFIIYWDSIKEGFRRLGL